MTVVLFLLRMKLYVLLATLFYFSGRASAVANQVIQDELVAHLFTNYSTNLIPICNMGENVILKFDLALRQIMDMNEREQILTTNVWVRMQWYDCRLIWNASLYDNIDNIMVYYEDIWVPDISLYDSASDQDMMPGKGDYRPSISSSGSVSYNFPTVLSSACSVNVRYFPFDTQRCNLQFGSWSHHGSELDIESKHPSGTMGDLDTFIPNAEWTVDEFPVEKHVLYYNCCPEPFPDITYILVMKRRPSFYLLTMMFPCILTSMVAALTFMLPVESGEKVSLEITVLLSLAVFMLVVSESMPPSSDNFPIIGIYFAASMVLVSLSCVLTILVLNVFYRGTNGRRVPHWAKLYIMKYLGRIVCSRHNRVDDSNVETTPGSPPRHDMDMKVMDLSIRSEQYHIKEQNNGHTKEDRNATEQNGNLETQQKRNGLIKVIDSKGRTNASAYEQNRFLKHLDDKKREDEINSEWRDLANIMDRLFLVIYSLITVIVTLALMLQCAIHSN